MVEPEIPRDGPEGFDAPLSRLIQIGRRNHRFFERFVAHAETIILLTGAILVVLCLILWRVW